jgi:ubiquitin-conjugating enzyme E2 H
MFGGRSRLMSDYDVNLVNDSMSEFFVKFHGPSESESSPSPSYLYDVHILPFHYIDN